MNEILTHSNRKPKIGNKKKVGKMIAQEERMADNFLILNGVTSFQIEDAQKDG